MRGAAEGEGGGPAVVELRGGPEELGHGHGEQVRDGVRAACEAVRAYLDRVRRFAPGSLVAAVLKLAARFMIGYAPADYRREMEALAEAAGVDRGSVFLLNAFDDIGANLACTAFAVLGGDDGVVLGRNLDYPVFTDEMCALSTVFRFRPASGRDFLSVAWPGYIGAVTAMNSAGLAVASLASPSPERTLRGVPLGLLYRRAVQYGKDLDDLVEVLRRGPRTAGNIVVAAAPDAAAAVEFTARRLCVREPRGGVVTAANHFMSPAMKPFQKRGFIAVPPGVDAPAEFFTIEYSMLREGLVDEGCRAGGIDAAAACRLLRTPHVSNPATVQSVVFLPRRREALVSSSSAPPVTEGPRRRIAL